MKTKTTRTEREIEAQLAKAGWAPGEKRAERAQSIAIGERNAASFAAMHGMVVGDEAVFDGGCYRCDNRMGVPSVTNASRAGRRRSLSYRAVGSEIVGGEARTVYRLANGDIIRERVEDGCRVVVSADGRRYPSIADAAVALTPVAPDATGETPNGKWVVYWPPSGSVMARYETIEAASAACARLNQGRAARLSPEDMFSEYAVRQSGHGSATG